jgi:hypothetical protein
MRPRKAVAALAAVTVPVVASLGIATSAFAAETPSPTSTVCSGSISGPVSGNLVVKAGTKCQAFNLDLQGQAYVNGELQIFGQSTVEKNVYVAGGSLQVINNTAGETTTFDKSIVITGSAGSNDGQNGFWDEGANTTIHGNLYYLNNTTPLYSGDGNGSKNSGVTTVDGSFVYGWNVNTAPWVAPGTLYSAPTAPSLNVHGATVNLDTL